MVKSWRRRLVTANATKDGTAALVRTSGRGGGDSVTGFEEAIRTLRNSILLGTFDRRLKSILFTSAAPAEGKTTTAVHFAIAHAQQKHKTLLIDCDLRRPGVHRKLGINPELGLAAALQNGMLWREKLVNTPELPDLDILPAGHVNRRAADLVGGSLPRILEEAGPDYDLIVVDAPPILGFSEPLQISASVDGVVVVAVAGQTNRKAVGAVLGVLQRVRANVVGLVLNEVTRDMSNTYHYYGYYGRYYRYYRASAES
jgi:capsular exopolysaccharide synthesis family protein